MFYNLLNHIGRENRDEKILQLSQQMKDMMQTRSFDNLMGPKVPHMKDGILNLLQVAELTTEEKMQLITLGYGDLLQHKNVHLSAVGVQRDALNLQLEELDSMKANKITFKFASFTTSVRAARPSLPRRVYIQMRFFTFPEVKTETAELTEPGVSKELTQIKPGGEYFLSKNKMIKTV